MAKKKEDKNKMKEETQQATENIENENIEQQQEQTEENQEEAAEQEETAKSPEEEAQELRDKYLRLTAEFDNYRKRTLKEKIDLSKSAGEDILVSLLPIMDDFERALEYIHTANDIKGVREGIDLIYNKFHEFFKQKGVKPIDAKGKDFDTNEHEAVTKIPAPDKSQKGKVVDVIQKGYYLNDRILRYSKVVIGE